MQPNSQNSALETLAMKVSLLGLRVLGGLHTEDSRTITLIGNVGGELWPVFSLRSDGSTLHPLDDWTKASIGPIAASVGAKAVYPFEGPPYAPFQTWALEAGIAFTSPIGPLIHPEYGLWHAYRAVLIFDHLLPLGETQSAQSPCATCRDKPCLSACPVAAFKTGSYDVPACSSHLKSEEGNDCLNNACAARRACPVGREYIYPPVMAQFHMRKFVELYGQS